MTKTNARPCLRGAHIPAEREASKTYSVLDVDAVEANKTKKGLGRNGGQEAALYTGKPEVLLRTRLSSQDSKEARERTLDVGKELGTASTRSGNSPWAERDVSRKAVRTTVSRRVTEGEPGTDRVTFQKRNSSG